MHTRAAAAVLLLAACAPAAPAGAPGPSTPPEGTFAVVDVRLFDGERTHSRTTVLVRDGRVAEVGPDLRVPGGVPRVDGRGATLLPGLIDAHVHTFSEEALDQAMRFGVTTVVDMFSQPAFGERMRQVQREGSRPRIADLHSAGILATAPGGHGTQYGFPIPTLTRPDEAQAWVDARLAEGSDFVKVIYEDGSAHGRTIPSLDRATMAAVVEAAQRRGRTAVVHVSTRAGALDAIQAGADGLAHLFFDLPAGAELVRLAAERGTFLVPTLTVLESATLRPSGLALLDDPRLTPSLALADEAGLRAGFPPRAGGEALFANVLGTTGALHAAGVPVLAGSDAPNPGTGQGVSIHRELELLVRAGLTPAAALRAATAAPADAFGLSDRGRVAPGLRADLLLVRGDPTTDVAAAREIVHVWKAGAAYDLAGARARIAAARAARARLAAAAAERPGLVADFEDGEPAAALGAGWMVSTDAVTGGSSTAEMAVEEAALRVSGTLAPSPFGWSGVMLSPGAAAMQPADLSAYRGISFRTRGDGREYQLMVFTRAGGMMPAVHRFPAGAEWTEVVVSFESLGALDPSGVTGFVWSAAAPPGPFAFELDDVRLLPR